MACDNGTAKKNNKKRNFIDSTSGEIGQLLSNLFIYRKLIIHDGL